MRRTLPSLSHRLLGRQAIAVVNALLYNTIATHTSRSRNLQSLPCQLQLLVLALRSRIFRAHRPRRLANRHTHSIGSDWHQRRASSAALSSERTSTVTPRVLAWAHLGLGVTPRRLEVAHRATQLCEPAMPP